MTARPNTLWPIGTSVEFVDAWGRNPITGRVARHYGESNVLVEEPRGVVHFGATARITSDPPAELSLEDMLA